MTEFEYVVWFQNPIFEPDDQDFEWPAVIAISASSWHDALAWGDVLARDYAERTGQPFLRSAIDVDAIVDVRLPRVASGERASDEHIGW